MFPFEWFIEVVDVRCCVEVPLFVAGLLDGGDEEDDEDNEAADEDVANEDVWADEARWFRKLVRCLFVGGAIVSPPSKSLLSELDASMIA